MGGSGGGGTPDSDDRRCEDLNFTVTLQSPNVAALEECAEGQTLSLRLQESDGVSAVVAYTDKGEIAGVVAGTGTARLKRCMRSGHHYIALILERDSHYCLVSIEYAVNR